MSRSRHIGLEQAETHGLRARTAAERRAALEEKLAARFADGDAEMVSRIRGELALLDAVECDGERHQAMPGSARTGEPRHPRAPPSGEATMAREAR